MALKKTFAARFFRKRNSWSKGKRKRFLARKNRYSNRRLKVKIFSPKRKNLFLKKTDSSDRFILKQKLLNKLLRQNKKLINRLKGLELKNFWGSFIKKGIRPLKAYFYVNHKFRFLTGQSVVFFYKLALELLRPIVYYKPRRFGALIHLIPRLISKKLGFSLAKRFLIKSINKRNENFLGDRIINELFDVVAFKSSSFQYKRDVYSEVVENRVYLRRRRGKKSF